MGGRAGQEWPKIKRNINQKIKMFVVVNAY
jgi:hypothetical protein